MRLRVGLLSVLLSGFLGCGGDDAEPVISSTVVGSYKGSSFNVKNGFATTAPGTPLIALGAGAISCGSESDPNPPSGRNAVISAESFDVGTYDNVFVNIYQNSGGDFEGTGASGGLLEITKSDDESLAGSIDFFFEDQEDSYSLSGSFEVIRCP